MVFDGKAFGFGRTARPRAYRLPLPRAAPRAGGETRLPAGVALAILTLLALGLWGVIIFVFRAVILGW